MVKLVSACEVITIVLEQYAQVHNITVAQAVDEVCRLFSKNPAYELACKEAVAFISPLVIYL